MHRPDVEVYLLTKRVHGYHADLGCMATELYKRSGPPLCPAEAPRSGLDSRSVQTVRGTFRCTGVRDSMFRVSVEDWFVVGELADGSRTDIGGVAERPAVELTI